jgi:hypothetical protein
VVEIIPSKTVAHQCTSTLGAALEVLWRGSVAIAHDQIPRYILVITGSCPSMHFYIGGSLRGLVVWGSGDCPQSVPRYILVITGNHPSMYFYIRVGLRGFVSWGSGDCPRSIPRYILVMFLNKARSRSVGQWRLPTIDNAARLKMSFGRCWHFCKPLEKWSLRSRRNGDRYFYRALFRCPSATPELT